MQRRDFLQLAFRSIAAAGMPGLVFASTGRRQEKPPNILFIMSDDHCSQAISAYGGRLADVAPTTNIDRLAKEGMLFKNCFVTNSICTPSRASILTGKYSHKNGVYRFTALDQTQPTLPKLLRKHGYHTGFVGKWHLHANPVGLDYWSILPGQGRYIDPQFIEMDGAHESGQVRHGKRTTYQGHSTDVITDKVLDYLRQKRPKDKPFLLFCHFKAAHDRFVAAPRYGDLFREIDIPEPPNLFDDYATRTEALRTSLQYIGHHQNGMDFVSETGHIQDTKERKKAQYQIYLKKYLRCVRGIDDNMKRILGYLDESKLAENTLVIYTGDQGFFLGEHGLYDKRFMYEESLRMPLLVRWPGKIKPGSVRDEIAINVDFAQTMLDAAGMDPDPGMQGRSLVPILLGKTPKDWRRSMYYRYYVSHFRTPAHFGVRTHTHKLICFQDLPTEGNCQWELYDLEEDPREMNNLYDDPECASIVKALKEELLRLQGQLKDSPQDMGNHPRIRYK